MPSPVGHLLGGTAVYLAGTRPNSRSNIVLLAALLGSLAPDFDFLPGIAIGDMRAFHHGISHSLALAILFGALTFLTARVASRTAARASIFGVLGYVSHVLLDWVSVNEGTRGVPLLWPFSDDQLGFPLHLFGQFHYGPASEGVWSIVHWTNMLPVVRELSILGALVIVLSQKERLRCMVQIFRT